MSANGIQHPTTSSRRSYVGTDSFSTLYELSNQGNKRTQPSMLSRESKRGGQRRLEGIHPTVVNHDIIQWYHMILRHPGATRLYDIIRARFYSERLSVYCRD